MSTKALQCHIRENMEPEAAATIASLLRATTTDSDDVNRQMQWFADLLVEMVGGDDEMSRLCKEVGL